VKPRFFATPEKFRAWLAKNHGEAPELLVGFYKKGCGKPSIDWPQSVDEALCFGWIDGVRRNIDADSYSIRFTPRRARSVALYWITSSRKSETREKRLARIIAMSAAGEKR
jgi:uncharacterized protein YdeI (YjbR/CyaY-like superfamily)